MGKKRFELDIELKQTFFFCLQSPEVWLSSAASVLS